VENPSVIKNAAARAAGVTRCVVAWDKCQPETSNFAMVEIAWTSFNRNALLFKMPPWGEGGNTTSGEKRFHPTQKPVKLYRWLLARYAKPGDKVLDTHVGSASSLVACIDCGHEYAGFETDADYYRLAEERLEAHRAQGSLFAGALAKG
jgi:site-specific DNA-methyltransferase (adenine-specific)